MTRVLAVLLTILSGNALAQSAASPFALCEESILVAEKAQRIPARLLPAISRVESGRLDPGTGRVRAWPWTINVEGTGYFFETKAEAIAAVQALQGRGSRSIDVGCLQVNLMHHPGAFPTLDDAFDPPANARYAARFLAGLHRQFSDWNLATAAYHSQDAVRGEDYQRRVFGRVMTPMVAGAAPAKPVAPPPPFGAFAPPAERFQAFAAPSTAFGAFNPAPSPPSQATARR